MNERETIAIKKCIHELQNYSDAATVPVLNYILGILETLVMAENKHVNDSE